MLIDVVNQKRRHIIYVIFRVLVYAIRKAFNKTVLKMTDYKVGKFTDPFLIEK